jgi:ribonuclease HI
MSKKKSKYYVVWDGVCPGVYASWEECKRQVESFEGAKYKSFESKELANEAFNSSYWDFAGQKAGKTKTANPNVPPPVQESLSVDAACSGNPGVMEYRGVYVKTGQEVFRMGPFEDGTNNVGEFLALVHGLALLKQKNLKMPLYTDSVTAISWIKAKKSKTKLEKTNKNEAIFDLIRRAENWLMDNQPITTEILKWDTENWGEIPADFGRK